MKVTFDSNVWRIVSSPEKFPKEVAIEDFKAIRNAIESGKVSAFLCETVFTLEAIQRNKRREFLSGYKSKAQTSISESEGEIKMSLSIGPDKSAHPGNSGYLESHLKDALSVGFKLVNLPRIAGIVNPDIEPHLYQHEDLKSYLDTVHAVAREIESKGAGIAHIKKKGEEYGSPWLRGLKKAPESEDGLIAKAVAEWADGDSVACHIALGGDFFCTRDSAKAAGNKSVLSEENLKWLSERYGFSLISPEALSQLLKGRSDAKQAATQNSLA